MSKHTLAPLEASYLDLKSLARYASCSVRWLRKRLIDPYCPLPCYRVGGKILVKVDEFDQWMRRFRDVQRPTDLDAIVNDVVASITTPRHT